MNKKELDHKTIANAENLDKLAGAVEERERLIDHMNNQRDALVENYIKGQKIAMCMWKNNTKQLLRKALYDWSINNIKITNATFEGQLKKNIDLIAALKAKVA